MQKRKRWQGMLTKTEIRHLKEHVFSTGERVTLKGLVASFERQARARIRNPDPAFEPCWTCRHISEKMGFPI